MRDESLGKERRSRVIVRLEALEGFLGRAKTGQALIRGQGRFSRADLEQ